MTDGDRVLLADGLIDLRLGRWQDVLADVTTCDAVICDPPYSARTHEGQRHGRRPHQMTASGDWASARGIDYAGIGGDEAAGIVDAWVPRLKNWLVVLTDSELACAFRCAAEAGGLTTFSPLAVVQIGMNVRLAGDGPSSWSIWAVVARTKTACRWGTLPGAYVGNPFEAGENTATASRKRLIVGGKPLWLMRAIVRDYTRPGDLVVDPFCGGGTTALACAIEGRRCITSEMDPVTFEKARKRLERGFTPNLFQPVKTRAKQGGLL